MARHLHEQSGGDPSAQGPVPELANEPPSPRADHDFPDTPEGNRPRAGGGDLTDEQLDDFAARLGLVDEVESGDTIDDGGPETDDQGDEGTGSAVRAVRVWAGRVRPRTARVLVVVGRVTTTAGARVRSFGERLDQR